MSAALAEPREDLATRMEAARVALRARTYRFTDERSLGDGVALVLGEAGIPFTREGRLDARNRPDFMLWGDVGLELKIKGSLADATRQLHRYARLDDVAGLILLASKLQLMRLPDELLGKPLRTVCVVGSML